MTSERTSAKTRDSENGPSYDHMKDSLARVSEWSRFADTKAAAVLVLLGLLLANSLTNAGNLIKAHQAGGNLGDSATILFWMAMGDAAVTVVLVSLVLFPRVKPKTKSLAYFGTIADLDSHEVLIEKIAGANEAEEVAKQVWEVSRIATAKYTLLKWAYRAAIVFLVLYVASRLCLWSN